MTKIGGDSNGGGSETFAIGNYYGFVPPDLEGLLWLTVNDEPRGFGDNIGAVSVTVNTFDDDCIVVNHLSSESRYGHQDEC